MASHGGTIRPVSPPTSHSLMCLYLEAVLLHEQQTEVSSEKNRVHSFSSRPRGVQRCYLTSALAILVGLLCMSSPCLEAQSTFGSIRGIVQDSTGASIPDAQITLHSVDENTDRKVNADATGSYAFENVLANRYSIRAQHDGFADTVVAGVILAARQDLRYTLAMTVATQSSTVEVTSSANQINTENGVIGDSKGTGDIGQLPLNFRASTTSPLAALATSANVQQDSQGNIAIGGATSNMTGFSVDGISTTNVFNSAAGANPYPSSEGIAELKVTAFNNNAEFSQVGDVTFTTKGGTNKFHGSLFEYLQNAALDARVYSFSEKAPKQFNTFGGSVGGPVTIPHLYNGHDKTFFFFDYEGNRRNTSQPEQYTVPSVLDRMGDLSDLASPSTFSTLNNPYTGQAYANNTIPESSINPFAKNLLNKYYPLPNLASAPGQLNYQTLVPIPSTTDGFDGRIDQVISASHQVYARYNWKNLVVNVVNPLLPNDVDSEHDRSFLVSDSYIFSPRLVNEFRFGFTNSILAPNFPIEGATALEGLGIQVGGPQGVNVSNHPTDQGFPTINFSDGTSFTPR